MAKKDTGRHNFQKGGPSGRERGTVSFTVKARTKRGKVAPGKARGETEDIHARCSPKDIETQGSNCNWLQKQFNAIAERFSEFNSDEEKKAERKRKAKVKVKGK